MMLGRTPDKRVASMYLVQQDSLSTLHIVHVEESFLCDHVQHRVFFGDGHGKGEIVGVGVREVEREVDLGRAGVTNFHNKRGAGRSS